MLDVLLFGGRVLPFRSQTRSGPLARHSKPTQPKQKNRCDQVLIDFWAAFVVPTTMHGMCAA